MKPKTNASEPVAQAQVAAPAPEAAKGKSQIVLPQALTVKQLADLLKVSAIEVIKSLMRNGIMANINQVIDFDAASKVAAHFGIEARGETKKAEEAISRRLFEGDEAANLKPRPPVVTIMGHVDHGKTSLLDAIRQTNVAASEAGSITQRIGAYQVEVKNHKITFLDTPGHEAFTAMRARGAQVTDVAVLVVAADDGVMPQTLEAIDHARAAGVPIVVAINKVDKATANPDKIKQQLADYGVVIEEWGGDVIAVPVSAKKKTGISNLLESIQLVSEMQELKADPTRPAAGVVIEAKLDTSRGPVATVLVRTGHLKTTDTFVVGNIWGKVKALFDDKGKRVKRADPSSPVEVLGMSAVPKAGDLFNVVPSDKEARVLVEQAQRQAQRAQKLNELAAQIRAGKVKELNVILKTDAQGSIDPIKASLERLAKGDIRVRIIHVGTGTITESDVMLAIASNGIIVGFNTRSEPGAIRLADSEGVDIRLYQVIYSLIEDVERALAGLQEPVYKEVVEGHGEVIALFEVRQGKVAGVRVTDGKITRGGTVRLVRKGKLVYEGTVTSLRHVKEQIKEAPAGYECGVLVEGFSDFAVGDVVEAYRKERVSA